MTTVKAMPMLSGNVIVFDRPRFGQYVQRGDTWVHPALVHWSEWATSGHGRGVYWTQR